MHTSTYTHAHARKRTHKHTSTHAHAHKHLKEKKKKTYAHPHRRFAPSHMLTCLTTGKRHQLVLSADSSPRSGVVGSSPRRCGRVANWRHKCRRRYLAVTCNARVCLRSDDALVDVDTFTQIIINIEPGVIESICKFAPQSLSRSRSLCSCLRVPWYN